MRVLRDLLLMVVAIIVVAIIVVTWDTVVGGEGDAPGYKYECTNSPLYVDEC